MKTTKAMTGRSRCAFTLVEVVTATAIGSLAFGGIIYGYLLCAQRAEWAAFSLAAQSLASMRLEQARACKWDPRGWPPVDELVTENFPERAEVLDVPVAGTNTVYATNTVTITQVSTTPPLKVIRVDCTWRFYRRGLFTNTVVTYRAPDQ
jgi:type II secretory pathway pseudopilin PulG